MTTSGTGGYTVAFVETIRLAYILGHRGISRRPGCWEDALDDEWWVALNAHDTSQRCSRGHLVDPLSAVFEYRGELVVLVSERGGGKLKASAGVTEAQLLGVLKDAIARALAAAAHGRHQEP